MKWMFACIAVAALLTIRTANGFASIQPSRSGSIVMQPSAPIVLSFTKTTGDVPSVTRLYATKKKKKRKRGNNRRSSGSGFCGSNNEKSKTATSAEVPLAASSTAPVSTSTEQQKQRRIRALRQLSTEPLIFTIDDFVSPETCLRLMQQTDQEAQLSFVSLVASELFGGQWGQNDGLRFNKASSSDANNMNDVEYSHFPEGLHVDTNNGSVYRSVTMILYLNDVPVECGGATVFPLAGVEDGDLLLKASNRLLKGGIGHTRGRAPDEGSVNDKGEDGVLLPSQEADALLLEQQQSPLRRGVWVTPQSGRLCMFFSRTSDGEIDPRSWHAGERLNGRQGTGEKVTDDGVVTEKQILTLFKEVSYGASLQHPEEYETTSFEDYLAPQIAQQREALQALAQSHAGFFI